MKSERVKSSHFSIHDNEMECHKYVILVAEVLFVFGLSIFITLSCDIWFVTVPFVPHRTAPNLTNALKDVYLIWFQNALMDNEFEKVQPILQDHIVINTITKNEHVGKIESKICHLKK